MIRPSTGLPALACSRQYAAAQRLGANVPFRWTLMTASHSSSVMLVSMRSRRMPALLTTAWRSPNVSIAVLISRCAPSHDDDAVAVGDGLAAHSLDLLDDLLGRAEVATRAVDVATEVVDHDLGAVRGQAQRVLAPDPSTGTGHDGDSTFT